MFCSYNCLCLLTWFMPTESAMVKAKHIEILFCFRCLSYWIVTSVPMLKRDWMKDILYSNFLLILNFLWLISIFANCCVLYNLFCLKQLVSALMYVSADVCILPHCFRFSPNVLDIVAVKFILLLFTCLQLLLSIGQVEILKDWSTRCKALIFGKIIAYMM